MFRKMTHPFHLSKDSIFRLSKHHKCKLYSQLLVCLPHGLFFCKMHKRPWTKPLALRSSCQKKQCHTRAAYLSTQTVEQSRFAPLLAMAKVALIVHIDISTNYYFLTVAQTSVLSRSLLYPSGCRPAQTTLHASKILGRMTECIGEISLS